MTRSPRGSVAVRPCPRSDITRLLTCHGPQQATWPRPVSRTRGRAVPPGVRGADLGCAARAAAACIREDEIKQKRHSVESRNSARIAGEQRCQTNIAVGKRGARETFGSTLSRPTPLLMSHFK